MQLPEKEEHYAVRLLNQNPNGLLVQRSGRSHLTVIRTHIFLNHLLSSVEWMIDDKQISVNRFFYLLSFHNLCDRLVGYWLSTFQWKVDREATA